MTDTKPTAENVERANRCTESMVDLLAIDSTSDAAWDEIGRSLAAEYAASDAIARRRALEEAEAATRECWLQAGHVGSGDFAAGWAGAIKTVRDTLALLRSPTSEKAEE